MRHARARERFLAAVLGVFAVLAVAIAAVGSFGVVTFVAARRTREFGLRLALGAEPVIVVLVASALPALRAGRVDPVEALREEVWCGLGTTRSGGRGPD